MLAMYFIPLIFIILPALGTTLVKETTVEVNPEKFVLSEPVDGLCHRISKMFKHYKWETPDCTEYKWNHVRNSNLGTPLIWTTFGTESDKNSTENTTLILCGVHGDEITPVKFCFDLMKNIDSQKFLNNFVVVAPLVAPDSFLKIPPTRTNGRGVDVNRNFPTKDWKSEAHRRWKISYKSDKRKYPGKHAASEQETIFQMNLIKRYKPNKIITVHAPLTLLDYDGPSLTAEEGRSAESLLKLMSEKSSGYKISNYPVFPGSLGNWAGKENKIPVYTLELPNTNAGETDKFWTTFKDAMWFAINHRMKPPID
jgi:murein peptide amidase A